MNILMVCQSGGAIGLGHLSRIFNLASELHQNFDVELELLIQGAQIQGGRLSSLRHGFIKPSDSLLEKLTEKVEIDAVDVMVFDLHPSFIPSGFFSLLKQMHLQGIKLVAIDCFSYFDCWDFVHIPTCHVDSLKLNTINFPAYYGWNSYLLPQVKQARVWKPGHKVLVLTGGSDVAHLGRTLPSQLDVNLKIGTEIHWVKGPYAEAPILPEQLRFSWVIHDAPSDLSDLMGEMNYAMTLFGVSFFELLQQGIPTVVFSPYENNDDELAAIAKEQVSVVARDQLEAVQALKLLMEDVAKAQLISECATQKLKISGAALLAQRIYELKNVLVN